MRFKMYKNILSLKDLRDRDLKGRDVTGDRHIFVSEQNGNLLSDRLQASGKRLILCYLPPSRWCHLLLDITLLCSNVFVARPEDREG